MMFVENNLYVEMENKIWWQPVTIVEPFTMKREKQFVLQKPVKNTQTFSLTKIFTATILVVRSTAAAEIGP